MKDETMGQEDAAQDAEACAEALESLDRISLDEIAFDDSGVDVQDEPETEAQSDDQDAGDVEPAEDEADHEDTESEAGNQPESDTGEETVLLDSLPAEDSLTRELPAYHFPAIRSWALHVWERCWAFIKKAGTVIFASTVVVWFLSNFGSYNGSFGFLPAMDGIPEEFTDFSVLAMLGNLVAWIFAPLGFSTWQATALTVSGLVAKENVVATAGSLLSVADAGETDPSLWTAFAGMFPTMGACVAFGAFNLLCAPCFAAIGTIRNQMDSGKWTAIAIGYECAFAWVIALFINQFYNLLVLGQFGIWTIVAIVLLVAMLFQIFRPMPKHAWTDEDETNTASAAVSA